VSKTAEAVFRCSLDSTSTRRLLQIPQWMFDSAVMWGVRLASTPVVDAKSLQALKVLLSATIDDDVIQPQHPSVPRTPPRISGVMDLNIPIPRQLVDRATPARAIPTTERIACRIIRDSKAS
jgi:hypothetical protein